jgi:hypothetical protein
LIFISEKKKKEYYEKMGEAFEKHPVGIPKHLPAYLKSDVDARIKFYKENHPEYPYPSIGDIPDWLWVLWDKSKFNRYPDFLFVFCFGDMNEDFREKIKRLKKP